MTSLHSTAITAASPLLRTSPPLYAASLLSASPFCGLNLFDWHLRTGSRVPHTGLFHAHAALMPDAEQPASGLLLPLSRAGCESPVLTSSTLTTLLQRFTFVHLHGTHLPIFLWTFPCCSPTLSLYQSGAGRFGGSACQFPPRGPPSSCVQFSRHTGTVRAVLVGRPGEFHPQSPIEPYVKLSLHTAPRSPHILLRFPFQSAHV